MRNRSSDISSRRLSKPSLLHLRVVGMELNQVAEASQRFCDLFVGVVFEAEPRQRRKMINYDRLSMEAGDAVERLVWSKRF